MNSASDVARKLLHEAHVVVVPGEGFGTQDHVRISYATSPENLAARPGAHAQLLRQRVDRWPQLYPFLMIPIFDERPWGVRDLRPVYTVSSMSRSAKAG